MAGVLSWRVVVGTALVVLTLGCSGAGVSNSPQTQQWVQSCDWCRTPYFQSTSVSREEHVRKAKESGFLVQVPTEDGPRDFCSLRCLNAYRASVGVKEKRERKIIGE